jgi:hypothetical protein
MGLPRATQPSWLDDEGEKSRSALRPPASDPRRVDDRPSALPHHNAHEVSYPVLREVHHNTRLAPAPTQRPGDGPDPPPAPINKTREPWTFLAWGPKARRKPGPSVEAPQSFPSRL